MGLRRRHHNLYKVEVKVIGRSMVGFLASITTMCICSCVGICALCSISWMSLSKGPKASGGADRSS